MARISVAMATYNGAAYVAEQLVTIVGQRRPPDELVVSDDGSDDGTVDIVRAALDDASFAVRVLANDTRLGVAKNFERAVAATTGDVVVLSDQDDAWEPHKLDVVESTLAAGAGAMFSDAIIVDEASRPTGTTLWDALRLTRRERAAFGSGRAFDVLLKWNYVTGATLAFDARLKPLLLPFPDVGLHDAWIATLVAAADALVPVPEPLIRYRVHRANQAGVPPDAMADAWRARRGHVDLHQREIGFFDAARRRLASWPGVDPGTLAAIDAKLHHLRARQSLAATRGRRVGPVAGGVLTGRYARYSKRVVRSAAYDIWYGAS